MKKFFLWFLILGGGTALWLWPDATGHYPLPTSTFLGQVFKETISPEDLQTAYQENRLKILLVPGHDPDYRGAEFGALTEAQVNLQLAKFLSEFLSTDTHFEVYSVRDLTTGTYEEYLAQYLEIKREEITSFRLQLREQFLALVGAGEIEEKVAVAHNFARPEVAHRLFGINKWANEQKIDLTFHLHFNDYPGRHGGQPGEYIGFSIYVPERQLPNARASQGLAQTIFQTLQTALSPSTLPAEAAGVIEDQELIAVGSNASREGAAVLVEYSYLYEPQIVKSAAVREEFLKELAWLTYRGLKAHFESGVMLAGSAILPHHFNSNLSEGMRGEREVLILQRALQLLGFYPPLGKATADCPLTGNFGPCVRQSLINFQIANQLPSSGILDLPTRVKLNSLPF